MTMLFDDFASEHRRQKTRLQVVALLSLASASNGSRPVNHLGGRPLVMAATRARELERVRARRLLLQPRRRFVAGHQPRTHSEGAICSVGAGMTWSRMIMDHNDECKHSPPIPISISRDCAPRGQPNPISYHQFRTSLSRFSSAFVRARQCRI